MFCSNCGKECADTAVMCPNCGQPFRKDSDKSKTAAILLCLFLGGFGAHRFYTGKTGSAVAQLLMCLSIILAPVTGIWALIDLIRICTGSFKTADGSDLK